MIELEVISAPNKAELGKMIFYKNKLHFGPRRSDFPLNFTNSFYLEFEDEKLIINNNNSLFLHNHKKALTPRALLVDDTFEINLFLFKVLSYKKSEENLYKQAFEEKLQNILSQENESFHFLQMSKKKLDELKK